MKTLNTAGISMAQLDELDRFSESVGDEATRELLASITSSVRAGDTIAIIDDNSTCTPAEAAKHLGLSRTHLYTVLDRDELPSHRVGRDRRIFVRDLITFEAQRRKDRRELAERFTTEDQGRRAAIDELTDLL